MPEISIEDLRRLARNFLIGKGGEAELEDTKRAMETDPQLAMEFLQQMQTAFDDVAPSGFNPAQWKEIDSRVNVLIAPLAKAGLGFGFIGRFFSRLFKKSAPAEGPARIKPKGGPPESRPKPSSSEIPTSLLTSQAVVASPTALPSEGMEDMAPIAVAPAPPAAPEPRVEAAPAELARPEPSPRAASKGGFKKFLLLLLFLLLAAGLGYGAWMGFKAWQRRKPAPVLAPQPTPIPTPPYSGPPRRSRPPAWQEEPLPSELPPMTPQPAGQAGRVEGLEAKDEAGRKGLPLP